MFAQVGDVTFGQPVKNIIGHAVAGCVSAVVGDGDCGRGAVSSAAGAAWSNYVPQSGMWDVDLAGASLAGGLTSTLSGGSFEEGAVSAAYGFAFNEYIHRAPEARAKYSVRLQRGHHIVPFGSTTEMDISSEARAYWGRSTTGIVLPSEVHMLGHDNYTKAVRAELLSFAEINNIDLAKMTVKQAAQFQNHIITSPNPHIKSTLGRIRSYHSSVGFKSSLVGVAVAALPALLNGQFGEAAGNALGAVVGASPAY